MDDRLKIHAATGEVTVDPVEDVSVGAVYEEPIHAIQEVVAGGAIDRPIIRQLLISAENLFSDDEQWNGTNALRAFFRKGRFLDSFCLRARTSVGSVNRRSSR